jgi:hypothetical protein
MMQHRAQQADDGLQRRFALAGREFGLPMLSSSRRWLSWTIGRLFASRVAMLISLPRSCCSSSDLGSSREA